MSTRLICTLILSGLTSFCTYVYGQELEIIKVGDTKEHSLKLIQKHDGLESRIAYSRLVDGKRFLATPQLSYKLPHEHCWLLVELDDDQRVSRVEYGVSKQNLGGENTSVKDDIEIKEVKQFVFSKKRILVNVRAGDQLEGVFKSVETSWKNRKVSENTYIIDGKRVEFSQLKGTGSLERIMVDGATINSIDIPLFVSVFFDREM